MLTSRFVKSSELASIKGFADGEAILAVPFLDRDMAARLDEILRFRAKSPGALLFIEDDARLGFMMAANLAYSWTESPFFGYAAQDAYPGERWLALALDTLKRSGAGLLAFNDGRFFGTLAVFGLVRRAWLKTIYPKTLFYPGYKSHFGDTELSSIAFAREQLIFNPNCLLMEIDYSKHRHGHNPEDETLYRRRSLTGFDGLVAPFEAPDEGA